MTTYRLSQAIEASSDADNPDAAQIARLLSEVRTVAVVGLSRDPSKAARRVPSYLAAKGFDVVPINPNATRILGKDALDSLDDLERPVDMVLVFRPSEQAGDVIRQAAGRPERPLIWLQEGIRNDEAAREARERGLVVVQDLCVYKVHRALARPPMPPVPR